MDDELVGRQVYNGLGEPMGTVVSVERDRKGRVRLRVREPGPLGPLRLVEREHVVGVDGTGIHLKGPRQGYHIAPLGRIAAVLPAPEPLAAPPPLPDPW